MLVPYVKNYFKLLGLWGIALGGSNALANGRATANGRASWGAGRGKGKSTVRSRGKEDSQEWRATDGKADRQECLSY